MSSKTLFISNIAWDFVWQRHQSLASQFARDGEVIFCELPGIRRVGLRDFSRILRRLAVLSRPASVREPLPPGLRIVRPWVVPSTNAFFHALNRHWLARFLRAKPGIAAGIDVIVNYSASRAALELIGRVPHRRLIYDCTDNWSAVAGIPDCLVPDERRLLARADLTLVPSRRLEELHRPVARRVVRLPHGAVVERFLVPPKPPTPQGALTLLYYGHLHAQHLDYAAIETMARTRPHWRILLVGPVKTPHVFPPNVELAGQQPHASLKEFVARADVLLLPYALNEYTRAVLPAKTYECLATGRPVVATPLPDLMADFAGDLTFASSPGEWVPAIERTIATDRPDAIDRRIARGQANSWESRYRQLSALVAGLPQ
jgi:glycosyltransferase involved in cell wall biosynthesis